MVKLSDPSVVIVIDLWDSVNDYFVKDIVSFINSNSFIENVYGGIYGLHYKNRKIHPYLRELNKPFDNISTKYEILDIHRRWDIHELRLKHLAKKSHIKNIYIVVTHWRECIKDRSLGYINLKSNFPDRNVIINKNLVAGFIETDIREEDISWTKLDEDNYLYHPPCIKNISSLNKELYHKMKGLDK